MLDWICHGRPERCFAPDGQALALCARCVGLHIGLIAGALAPHGRTSSPLGRALTACGILQLVVLAPFGLPGPIAVRAASGLWFGFAIGRLVLAGRSANPRGWRTLATLLLGACAVAALALTPSLRALVPLLPLASLGVLALGLARVARRLSSPA